MKRKQALGLILFSILAFGCSSPYGLEEGEGTAPGQDGGFNGYGDGATYGNNNSFGRGGAGTGDYYNDPQYGVNVVGGPQSADKDRIIYFSYDSSAIDSRAPTRRPEACWKGIPTNAVPANTTSASANAAPTPSKNASSPPASRRNKCAS